MDIVLTVEIPTSIARDVLGPAMEIPTAAVEVPVAIEVPAIDVVAGVVSRTGKEP